MKKYFPSYIRLPLIFFASAAIFEYFIDSGDQPAFIKYPEVGLLLLLILFLLIAFEICLAAINNVVWRLLSPEERKAKLASEAKTPTWLSKFIKDATNATPIENEADIVLNHNYDGIKELDNSLPPWWVWGFYATIVFAVIYLARFHVFGGYTQAEEFEQEMEIARIEIEEYKKIAKDMVDYTTVTALTDATALDEGKAIYTQNCAVCHKPDGGGSIGPNLTDKHWILGGGINNIFKTISEGGRPSKGMEAWAKKGLKPSEIQKVASYILTMEGTNPPGAKEAQGEVWEAPKEEVEATQE